MTEGVEMTAAEEEAIGNRIMETLVELLEDQTGIRYTYTRKKTKDEANCLKPLPSPRLG